VGRGGDWGGDWGEEGIGERRDLGDWGEEGDKSRFPNPEPATQANVSLSNGTLTDNNRPFFIAKKNKKR
jgi:hypothetical protein